MNVPLDSASTRRSIAEQTGRAGMLAALVMLAVQLIWRLNWSENGVVQAFPEFIVAAISRLTPLSIFGAATENYGSLAKKTLFAAVLIGIVAVGFRAGQSAGWLSRRIGHDGFGRLVAGLIVAAVLWLFTMLVVMPIAYLGVFATKSSYTNDILVQLSVTFALFGVLWAVFAAPRLADTEVDMEQGELVTRRSVLGGAAWGVGTLAAAVTVGGAAWRLVNPRAARGTAITTTTTTTTTNSVDGIVATQRALQGHPLPTPMPTPTPEPEARTSVVDVAELQSDVAADLPTDPIALFVQLDAEEQITPVLTETDDFYHVSKNLSDPEVGANSWRLKVSGMVNQPLELTYDEVMTRSTMDKITTLMCISNELNGDLTGTAQWTGFLLKDLLEQAGIQDGAVDLKLRAADDYEDSIPLAAGLDPDTMVVTGMNGEALRDDHGFPARIIVPGIYGMKNVKWLTEIEVVGEDFKGYWQTRGWSDPAIPQIWGRIDEPSESIPPGPFIATGLASAGDRDIARVEISLDDGDTWADAILEPSLNPPLTWVRWAFPFEAQPGKYKLRMRAHDGTGQVMTEIERAPLPDGATGWPRRRFEVKQ